MLMVSIETWPHCISAARFIGDEALIGIYKGIKFLRLEIKDKGSAPEELGKIEMVPTFIFAHNGKEIHRVLGGDKFKKVVHDHGISNIFLEKTQPPVFK